MTDDDFDIYDGFSDNNFSDTENLAELFEDEKLEKTGRRKQLENALDRKKLRAELDDYDEYLSSKNSHYDHDHFTDDEI